jgi:hypothetical protein
MTAASANQVATARQIIETLQDHLDDFLGPLATAHGLTLSTPAASSYAVGRLVDSVIPPEAYRTPAILVGWESTDFGTQVMAGEYLTTTRYAISIITSEQDVASDRLDVILESAQDYATAVGQCLTTHLEADARAATIPIPLHTAYVVEEAVNLPLNFDDIEEQTSALRVTDVVLEVMQYQSIRG